MGSERRAVPITSEEDINQIEYPSEQEFARLMLGKKAKNPDLAIIYEPGTFWRKNRHGMDRGTSPDFLVQTPGGVPMYIELTLSRRNNGQDPKESQRKTMARTAKREGARYVVLYRENFDNMQRSHPEFGPILQAFDEKVERDKAYQALKTRSRDAL